MGCSTCATGGGCSTPTGCGNNGACLSGSCNKMNTFDWLSNMELPGVDLFDVVEVRFKGGRKEFFKNQQRIFLNTGDPIVVEMQNGYHVGHVALQGELVKLQMRKRKVSDNEKLPIIYRQATSKDLEKYEDVKKREMPTMFRSRQIIEELQLNMKLSDVEYQADNTKATFYYSADDRVDFRELIKVLAGEFKIRVEMRQISLRQEAGRVGGIGSCGRELCCSTWLTDFKSVSTSAARYQNLSLNPTKLSGQCGRLKCCLNYELETYQDALIDIPEVKKPLLTKQGEAHLQKVDIFKKLLWFSLPSDNNWYPVEAGRVKEIQALNEQGREPETLMSEDLMLQDEYKSLVSKDARRQAKSRSASKRGTAETKASEGRKERQNVVTDSAEKEKPNHPKGRGRKAKAQKSNSPKQQHTRTEGTEKKHNRRAKIKHKSHKQKQENNSPADQKNKSQGNNQNPKQGGDENKPNNPKKKSGGFKNKRRPKFNSPKKGGNNKPPTEGKD